MYDLAASGGPFAGMNVAPLTVIVGGALGWWLRALIAPEGPATTAIQLGRSWAGWIVFVSSFTLLARFFGKPDVNSFAVWIVGGGLWAIVAYFYGWAYGNYVKFKSDNVTMTSPATEAAASSTLASSAVVDRVQAREAEEQSPNLTTERAASTSIPI